VTRRALERVLVVVPARDEAMLLGRQLAAIEAAARALRRVRPEVEVATTVVLDSCTDASAEVVARFPGMAAVAIGAGCVGEARRVGVEAARSPVDVPEHTWVACTDADSEVPVHWLVGQVALATSGVDLVLGTVWPDPVDAEPGLLARWWSRHGLGDGHPYVHGANLGVALSAYDAVGGFRALPVGEDVDLVGRLKAAGVAWTATSRLPVLTSSRRAARAPAGFATYLLSLEG
jgi:hypothetical protein